MKETIFCKFNKIAIYYFIFILLALFCTINNAKAGDNNYDYNDDEKILIPVVRVNKYSGQIITDQDIEIIKLSKHKLNDNIIQNTNQIVGMVANHHIKSGKPINIKSIKKPILVNKNDTVSIVYEKNNIYLKTIGIAKENGSLGNFIDVKNANSSKVIRGKVIDNNLVMVN